MRISNVSTSNREVLDHAVAHHGFEVSLIWTDNNYLFFVRNLGGGNLFLGETFKISPNSFFNIHILWFLFVYVWYDHIIFFELDLSIVGVYDVISIPSLVGDAEPHIFEPWDDKDVINPLLVDTAHDGTE